MTKFRGGLNAECEILTADEAVEHAGCPPNKTLI